MSRLLRRTVVLMRHFPALALTLSVASAIAVALITSVPLFIADVDEAAWEQEQARLLSPELGLSISAASARRIDGFPVTDSIALFPELNQAIDRSARDQGLGALEWLLHTSDGLTAVAGNEGQVAQLGAKTDDEGHLEYIAGDPADPGALVPAPFAAALGLQPGSSFTVRSFNDAELELRVAAVYRALEFPLPAYWQRQSSLFLPRQAPLGDMIPAPSLLLIGHDELVAAAVQLTAEVNSEWRFPLPEGMASQQAAARQLRYQALESVLLDPAGRPAALLDDLQYQGVRTTLPQSLANAERTLALVRNPVEAVGLAAAALGLAVVGLWTALRARRRQVELRQLSARGVPPLVAGGHALAEAVLPLLAGAAAGAALAVAAVRWRGPAAAAVDTSLVIRPVAIACLGSAAVIVVVTAAHLARGGPDSHGVLSGSVRRLPWEAIASTLAVVAAVLIVTGSGRAESSRVVAGLVLLFPILFVAGASGITLRLLQRCAPWAGRRVARAPVAVFLAVRRVLAAPESTRLLLVVTALLIGTGVYAAALSTSSDRTLQAKAALAVGSDISVQLDSAQAAAAGAAPSGTTSVFSDTRVKLRPSDVDIDLLSIDPASFEASAYWDQRFADMPLRQLLDRLAPGADGRVPAFIAGANDAARQAVAAAARELTVDGGVYTLPITVVGQAEFFPNMVGSRPLIVVSSTAYGEALEAQGSSLVAQDLEVWGRGDPEAVVASLERAGLVLPEREESIDTAAEFLQRPELQAQRWSLDYTAAVAGLAGLLGLLAISAYGIATQRRRATAGVLLTRMGFTQQSARTATALELLALSAIAALLGTVLALAAAAFMLPTTNQLPSLPPRGLFEAPGLALASVTVGVALIATVGAVVAVAATRSVPVGEVLRDAD